MIAVLLSALAGYVDSVGFIASGGYFASFMSGNSTRLGVAIAGGQVIGIALALIGAFLSGVVLATLVAPAGRPRRRMRVLLLVSALLAAAAVSAGIVPVTLTLAFAACAMGAENGVFAEGGDTVGLTYMTGTLVKVGQRIAAALTGGPRWGWVPHALLWLGLIGGGVTGGLTHGRFGLSALWAAAAVALAFALLIDPIERAARD
ncbi:MAG: DUF1275 domain-containing protein [Sphingomonas sp.]|nr:DUF1275 domain-containing protein [Sphingomonas sp.]